MLSRLRIRTKILGVVFGVSLIGATLAVFSSSRIDVIGKQYSALVNQRDPGVVKLVVVAKSVSDAAFAAHRLYSNPSDQGQVISSKALRGRSMKRVKFLIDQALDRFPENKEQIESLRDAAQRVGDASVAAIASTEAGNADDTRSSLARLDETYFAFGQAYSKLFDEVASSSSFQTENLDRDTEKVIKLALLGSLGGIAVGIILSLVVTSRGITGPLRGLRESMNALASGELQAEVPGGRRRDEIGDMARAVEVFKSAANENRRLAGEAEMAYGERQATQDRRMAEDAIRTEKLRDLIANVKSAFDDLARGKLTTRISGDIASEFEPIQMAFNSSVAKLEKAIAAVDASVNSMQGDLNAISQSAADLSRRTEHQAAALEETSTALADVLKKIEQSSSKSSDASTIAQVAHNEAKLGVKVVADAITAMSKIEESSAKINNIVGLIDQIAFQTNLLALNAGVEAARAGDSGRGFAVVAQEVRSLAQQSAVAAREIKSLISSANRQVVDGVALVTQSGVVLERILTQVDSVACAIGEIAISAQEQSVSLHQVSTAAAAMDRVTQQNAGMVEETNAATQNLLLETTELAEQMAAFETSEQNRDVTGPSRWAA